VPLNDKPLALNQYFEDLFTRLFAALAGFEAARLIAPTTPLGHKFFKLRGVGFFIARHTGRIRKLIKPDILGGHTLGKE
jgi:hypothetical protein